MAEIVKDYAAVQSILQVRRAEVAQTVERNTTDAAHYKTLSEQSQVQADSAAGELAALDEEIAALAAKASAPPASPPAA